MYVFEFLCTNCDEYVCSCVCLLSFIHTRTHTNKIVYDKSCTLATRLSFMTKRRSRLHLISAKCTCNPAARGEELERIKIRYEFFTREARPEKTFKSRTKEHKVSIFNSIDFK